ncbi:hypothetical protein O6H91_07G132100 [Diphasiastrum complanatum]|uniref:Uncharacterized protein n=1 Tax=Diphasiastrum complanatum TaxID=34168 RepID=A0ACC2D9Z3_DIPCM|nr:hypothetical protein O6H91_07G132100 [Diphasiastrum complanatum]
MRKDRHSKLAKDMELEAKRLVDAAWYPCIVSISSKNSNLKVQGVEPEFTGAEYLSSQVVALAQLRARSEPLVGDGCLQVKEGHVVLAQLDSGRKLLFDAKVEKVRRLRHAPGTICKCNYEIRWLEGKRKGGKATVRAELVRRLVNADILKHPVIAEWLNLLESKTCTISNESHSKSSLPDSDIEGDIQTRLEQQIEQIAQFVDIDSRSIRDSLQTHRGRKRAQSLAADFHHGSDLAVSLDSIPSRLSVHNKSASNGTVIKENHVNGQTLTSILREQKRPRLSPLAARAALAAAMQESLELSHKESNSLHANVGKRSVGSNTHRGVATSKWRGTRKNISATQNASRTTANMTNTRSSLPPIGRLTRRTAMKASTNVSLIRSSPRRQEETLEPLEPGDNDLTIMEFSELSPNKKKMRILHSENDLSRNLKSADEEKMRMRSLKEASGTSDNMADMQTEVKPAAAHAKKYGSMILPSAGKGQGFLRGGNLTPTHKVGRKSPRLALKDGMDEVEGTEPSASKFDKKPRLLKSLFEKDKIQPQGAGIVTSARSSGSRRSSRLSFGSTAQVSLQPECSSLTVKTNPADLLYPTQESTKVVPATISTRRGRNAVGLGIYCLSNETPLPSPETSVLKSTLSIPSQLFDNTTTLNVPNEQKQPRRSSRFDGKGITGGLPLSDLNNSEKVNPSVNRKCMGEGSVGQIQTKVSAAQVERNQRTRAHLDPKTNKEKISEVINLGPEISGVASYNQCSSVFGSKHQKSSKPVPGKPSLGVPLDDSHTGEPGKSDLNELYREQNCSQLSQSLQGRSSTKLSLETMQVCKKSPVGSRKSKQNPKTIEEIEKDGKPSIRSSSKSNKKGLTIVRKESRGFVATRTSRRFRRRNISA